MALSNMALAGIMVAGIFFILIVFVGVFAFYKHNQYQNEVKGKFKAIILPEAGDPETKIVTKDFSRNWVKIPDGQGNEPRYIYNKENTWKTRYPSDPLFGITWLCVQIDTSWYFKGNPEPLTSHPLAPLATAQSIAAAIDEEFELILKKVSASMLAMEKKLTEALAAHLNPTIVYGLLILLIVMIGVSLYFSFSAMQSANTVKHAFGM